MSRAGLLTTAALLAAAALICLMSPAAKAYELSGDAWQSPTTSYDVNLAGGPPGFTIQQLNQTFFDAMQEWNNVTSFTLNANLGVYKDPCSNPNNDPIGNGVQFSEQSCAEEWGSTTLAATIRWSSGGQIVQAGIVFNETRTWVINDDPPSFFNIDFKRVAVHELGHAMGLNHEDSVPAIMSTALSDIIAPTSDDIAGIEAIYNPSVDVGVTLTPSFESATVGVAENFNISVLNSGTTTAENTVLTLGYNPPRAVTSLSINHMGCSSGEFEIQCSLGSLQAADVNDLTGTISPDMIGSTELVASVTTSNTDSDASNNASSATFEVSSNPDDVDADGIDNDADNCPFVSNPDQADSNNDGVGDACVTSDFDGDGIFDHLDNCPALANASQADADNDGNGDPCDEFSAALLSLAPSSTATFAQGDAQSGSSFDVTLTNNSSLAVGQVAFRMLSLWPGAPNSVLITDDANIGTLDAIEAGSPANQVSAGGTLSTDFAAPIILGLDYVDPESNAAATIYAAYFVDGSSAVDSDGDTTIDADDAFPFDLSESLDSDSDGIGNNADPDDDNDFLSDEAEGVAGTDPLNRDTDGDGMPDGFEVNNGFDPLVSDCPPGDCESDKSNLLRLVPRILENRLQ